MTHIMRGKKPSGKDNYNTKSPAKGSQNLGAQGAAPNKLMAATAPKMKKRKGR